MSAGCAIDACPRGPEFLAAVLQNRFNAEILDRTGLLGFTDWWLTAGCLAQTVWNLKAGKAPETGIEDYDLFYFDPDTSWGAEDHLISRCADLFSDLPIRIELRNQARVPIWYRQKFGLEYGAVQSASGGIDRFAYQTTAIGLRRELDGDYRLYAPFGVEAALDGRVIPNKVLPIASVYAAKVARWKNIWPHLDVMPWAKGGDADMDDD
ncbi:MAG: nucleotidyltransferase family protein [Thalassospira sp.]|nr:nucleotidyltransferase family protein [Thalassospira sp.]